VLYQHKTKQLEGFTKRYNITKLVHWEETSEVGKAIDREKELKRWGRPKKVALIERENPKWQDLAKDWYDRPETSRDS
jgi:putative endonuclease